MVPQKDERSSIDLVGLLVSLIGTLDQIEGSKAGEGLGDLDSYGLRVRRLWAPGCFVKFKISDLWDYAS